MSFERARRVVERQQIKLRPSLSRDTLPENRKTMGEGASSHPLHLFDHYETITLLTI